MGGVGAGGRRGRRGFFERGFEGNRGSCVLDSFFFFLPFSLWDALTNFDTHLFLLERLVGGILDCCYLVFRKCGWASSFPPRDEARAAGYPSENIIFPRIYGVVGKGVLVLSTHRALRRWVSLSFSALCPAEMHGE